MQRIRFRNGVAAPELLLEEKFETKDEARSQLPELLHKYRTVEDAAAWLDGDKPPKHLRDDAASPEPELDPEPEAVVEVAEDVAAEPDPEPEPVEEKPIARKK